MTQTHPWAATWQIQQNECAPSVDSDQPGHPPSLIRFFAVRMKKAWVLSYPLSAQRRLWSDWADAQAELSLRWAHSHFVGFVMSRLICIFCNLLSCVLWNLSWHHKFWFGRIYISKNVLIPNYIHYCNYHEYILISFLFHTRVTVLHTYTIVIIMSILS